MSANPPDPMTTPKMRERPLTDEQLEIAARKYCELMDIDPDQMVPEMDGEYAICTNARRWQSEVGRIREHHALTQALAAARAALGEGA